jgi:branched-chain amino acid transport system permease protein
MLKEEDFQIGGYPGILIVSLIFCVSVIIILYQLLNKTKIGVAMRAAAEDKELSSILGINVNRIQVFSWFLTGGLASVAGALLPFWFISTPGMGGTMITTIMAGSLLGGLYNVYGAVIGGFGIGMSEVMGSRLLQDVVGTWVGEYRTIVPMLMLVAILLIEPRGLQPIYDKIKKIYQEWRENK